MGKDRGKRAGRCKQIVNRLNYLSVNFPRPGFDVCSDTLAAGATGTPRAFSLVETVLSIFLLLTGGLACLELVAVATRHQANSSLEIQGARVADLCLASIRRWADDPNNYYGNWDLYNDDALADPTGSGFDIHVWSSSRKSLASPGGAMESSRSDRRLLAEVSVGVKVRVRWGRQSLEMISNMGAPRPQPHPTNPLRIRRVGGPNNPVPLSNSVQMVCALYDKDDHEIPGVAYSWVTEPYTDATHSEPGNGWLESPRASLGREVQLFHRFYSADPPLNVPPHAVPGSLRLRAQADYVGRAYAGYSSVVELAP